MNFYDDQSMTTRELFEKFFPGREDVVRLLMEPITYANGSTLEDPAITYGIVFSNFMAKGVFIYEGGTDDLVTKMQAELVKNGVDIRIRCDVERIMVGANGVEGIQVNGKTIRCKSVVSNSNLRTTIFQMVGTEHFDPTFVEKANAVRLNNSSTQVYMALKEGETIDEETGDLLFCSTAPLFRTEALLSRNITSRTFSFYYPRCRPTKKERYAVVSSTNANWSDWANMSDEEYEASKKDLIETLWMRSRNTSPIVVTRSIGPKRRLRGPFITTRSINRGPASAPSSKALPLVVSCQTKFQGYIMLGVSASSCRDGLGPSTTV